jgi:hypothetical protein
LHNSIRWFLRSPGCSTSISGNRLSSNALYAALNRRSGWRSIFCELGSVVRERASRALSIPEAFMVGSLRDVSECESSRDERSSVPLDFFGAAFPPAFFGLEGSVASSAASRASRSAFLAAASAAFAAAASLFGGNRRQ